ncbi:MAG: urease accessory protein UreE, partial [Leptolyngbyaceae bacterium]|nr:urease accessory protein UreE [Leptolyngbyaceae bacterium]
EAVLTVRGQTSLDLMKAAYHLGNRHVAVEVNADYLRLSPDPVLKNMLVQMGLTVTEDVQPFTPETGAYHHH